MEEEHEQEFHVEQAIRHPQFDQGPFYNNDIALLRVKPRNGNLVKWDLKGKKFIEGKKTFFRKFSKKKKKNILVKKILCY